MLTKASSQPPGCTSEVDSSTLDLTPHPHPVPAGRQVYGDGGATVSGGAPGGGWTATSERLEVPPP
eukprot:1327506-Prymnesium_polylepis.1